MKAGRELDELIATKIMGWSKKPDSDFWTDERGRVTAWGTHLASESMTNTFFCPSTDIKAALKVIEAIGDLQGDTTKGKCYKPVVRIEWYGHDGIASCKIGRCKSMDDIAAESGSIWGEAEQSICLAICKAALRAKCIEVSE